MGAKVFSSKCKNPEAEDALTIAAAVKRRLETYQTDSQLDIAIWDDQTDILEQRLGLLIRNGILGFALVFLFLAIMLDLRLATWVAMGVPISFLGAVIFFAPFDVNINMISLFGLIIVLGLVVDDAVVVGENIISEQEQGGAGNASALRGVRGVFGPVLVGVLTTMAAFAPLLFVTGTFGQILGSVPIVVILVLTMSLLEVFLILPAHLSHGRPWSRGALKCSKITSLHELPDFATIRWYQPYSSPCGAAIDPERWHRHAISRSPIGQQRLSAFIFFPELESNSIRASLEFPVGTPFNTTKAAAERIVDAAYTVNEQVGGTSFRSQCHYRWPLSYQRWTRWRWSTHCRQQSSVGRDTAELRTFAHSYRPKN